MTGEGDGSLFNPDGELTREEAAKVLVEAFVGSVDSSYDAGFSDVVAGQWYTDYVNTAALYGIFSGMGDGTSFGVGVSINRADFAKAVISAAGLESDGTMGSDMFSDVSTSAYYDSFVGTAYAYSIVDGTSSTTYSPGNNVTRGQAAKMTYNSMNPVYRGEATVEEEETGSADATVTVALSDDTAVGDTLPNGATSVQLASFDLTAEGEDSVLDGLTVHQHGISSASTMTVYLYNGADRLTTGTTSNSTTHESDFRNLNLELPEGETVTVTVRADMGTFATTGEIGFEIASADKVDVGESSVEGDFPATGATFDVSTTAAGTITVEKNGNVDNADVGEDDAYVGQFKLTAGSVEGGYVQELGIYVAGTISTSDVENFRLYLSGDDAEPIAQVDMVDDLDVVRFVVGEGEGVMEDLSDGYQLAKGDSKSFYVLADFNTGRTGDTVQMYVDQNTDVSVVGDLYGYGMTVVRTTYDGDTCTTNVGDCTFQTLQGGDVTVSSNGPAATDIAINGKDVALLNFVVTSITDVTFDNFPVALTGSEAATDTTEGLLNGTVANFTDIKIVDTDSGSQVYSSVDSTSLITTKVASGGTLITEAAGDAAIAYYVWTDDWFVDAGSEYNLALKTDIANTSTLDPMTLIGSLPFDGTFPALKDSNNKALTNSSVLVPNSSITGKTMTVRAPSLTLSLASTPAGSNTYVKGQTDVDFTGIVFACGQATDCRITSLTLQGSVDDNGGADSFKSDNTTQGATRLSSYVGSVALVDSDGETIAAAKSVSSSTSVVQYTNMDWTIDAGDTVIAYVNGNISTDAFAGGNAENIAFGLYTPATNVTVENGDGNSFSATGTVNGTFSGVTMTTPSTYATTVAGGTLTVATSSATARENIAVAGTDDVEVSKFELSATREDFVVSKLSLNNRQSAASTVALGDYDDNVVSLSISYTNSAGATETKDAFLVSGTASFTGLDLYVPKNGTANVTAYATLTDIVTADGASSPADAGTFVDLAMAFDNFEALASSSGSTYKASNLDATTANLSIGTIAWTDGTNLDVNSAANVTVPAAGSVLSLTVNDNADGNAPNLPVGTLLCQSGAASCDFATQSAMVVTAWTEQTAGFTDAGNIGDTVATLVINDADTEFADGDNLVYSLPGTGYFSGTNQMVLYESKPTVVVSASSPSGTGYNTAVSDDAFIFSVTANANEKLQVRTMQALVDDTDPIEGTGNTPEEADITTVITATTSNNFVDGTAGLLWRDANGAAPTANDCFLFDNGAGLATGVMDDYAYVSFWIKSDQTDIRLADFAFITDTNNACAAGTTTYNLGSLAGVLVDGATVTATTVINATAQQWHLVTVPIAPTSAAIFGGIAVADATRFGANENVYFDAVTLHNEMLVTDITSDVDFNMDDAAAQTISLTESGTTVATGAIGFTSVSTAHAYFVPSSVNIEIAAGATKSYKFNLNTQNLLDEDSGVDDPLTFSIDMGTSSGGTVTAGDFWWYETNSTVRWLGDVTSTTLSGSHSY